MREAGGEVFDFAGGNKMIAKREVLATNGKLTEEMLEIICRHFKTEKP